MKLTRVVVMLFALLGIYGRAAAVIHEVKITDYQFTPDSLSVSAGDTVKWVCDQGYHSSTSGTPGHPDGKWDSGDMNPGGTFSHVFADPGRNPYYCKIHEFPGVIVVTGAGLSEKIGHNQFTFASVAPNPFARSATITYSLSTVTHITLTVYDAAGQLVRTLVNGYGRAGFNRAVWDGADDSGRRVGAGIYFCRCQAGDFGQIEKLIKIK